ncbi:PAS domain S-box-containing protein/diguanylate cyclase (GGDEF)-like protein [Roseateles toxinivorans]|uniref:PAS domain S-box-containing protein/diguanylate cyclase (GGDEF)-like protein n=1 Tax=Roseateles toxinivorans TaxID=270368 RepID=A0A4R6QT14_9BURK|nr:PAS domain S-box-containing protein/diguanylate cyclase (GGDEF)-like protein [Roseateles toxinivorans]
MQARHKHPCQSAAAWGLLLLSLPLLWLVSHPSRPVTIAPELFLFLHSAVELVSALVSLLVFVTGYRAILPARKGAVVLLGLAFLGVGVLDFLHSLSDTGMPDALSPNSMQKSTYFWILARMLAATTLLFYALLPAQPNIAESRKPFWLALMLVALSLVCTIGLLWSARVPALFVEGSGRTPLLTGFEWLTIGANALTLWVLWLRRQELARECVTALIYAVALSAVSGLFFTMAGILDHDAASGIGHLYKVAAYLYLFHVTFNEALRRPLERLETQHQREKLALSVAPDGVLWVNRLGQILMANPAMETLSGYPSQELIGRNVDIFLPPHLRDKHGHAMREYFASANARAMGSLDLRLMRRDGRMLPVDISVGHWEDESEQHAIAYVRDLTERKSFEESLRHRATHDELTGLPNRWLFRLQLNQAIAQTKRSERRVAALFLDLDDFKTVNDSFGHLAGDELLVQVSQRLRSALREGDTLARLGGDEFGILLSDLNSVDEAVTVAEKLLLSLDLPCIVQGQEVDASGSIGLAFSPDDAQDCDNLLRYADLAMYQAKRAGRGTYACYSAQLDKHAHANMQMHARLKDAINRGGLRLLYQPQVDTCTGAIVGAEALLRWTDELLGEVSPSRFIPVAETTGLILPLSDWVLETACRQIAIWSDAGTPLRVAVNFSAQQFRQRNLPDKVRAALQRSGAPARLLEIEITESIAMVQPVIAREQLESLAALGCTVALDDFGTGYSSLAYLKALPVSKLKIDRAFISDIPHDMSDVKISRSIIALAHSLGLTLVAEGVETEAQLEFLRDHGCEAYQGWLFARALDAVDFSARLDFQNLRAADTF